ncbi:COG4223 family protein [Paracoccus sp. (in: a-proteobacteria)]|uniref:COG4223 family protein n=1 Tax=Paracoccus sp. TaxID=267 RepID=UPI00396CAEEF
MKQPDKTKAGGTAAKTASAAAAGDSTRKSPAAPGVIGSAEVGEGKPAQAGQPGEISPIPSTLVGEGNKGLPAAERKAGKGTEGAAAGAADTAAPLADKPRSGSAAASSSSAHAGGSMAKPAAPARRSGFWPMALGGAVAAGLGAAATIYALPHLPPEWRPVTAAESAGPATDQAAVIAAAEEAARRTVAEELAAQPADAADDGLAQRVEAVEARLEESAAPQNQEDIAALQQRLEEQQARIEELAARPAFDPQAATNLQQQIESAAAEAQQQLDAARTEAQELQDAAAESTRRAEAVAAIANLQAALDRGVTPEEARETLEGAGLQTPEALTAEVSSLSELQTDFPEASRGALRASLRESSASGESNLVTNFLRAQTGARSVEAREGDDPDAILSRADAEVSAGRIDAAVTELEALPEVAREAPLMADWLTRATAYRQAQSALSELSSNPN